MELPLFRRGCASSRAGCRGGDLDDGLRRRRAPDADSVGAAGATGKVRLPGKRTGGRAARAESWLCAGHAATDAQRPDESSCSCAFHDLPAFPDAGEGAMQRPVRCFLWHWHRRPGRDRNGEPGPHRASGSDSLSRRHVGLCPTSKKCHGCDNWSQGAGRPMPKAISRMRWSCIGKREGSSLQGGGRRVEVTG